MTKSQCSNEIVRNQALIAQYESEIRGYQEQISELQETKTKLGVLQARLSDSKTASNTKLAETESLNKINSKIVSGFMPECQMCLPGSNIRMYMVVWIMRKHGLMWKYQI